MAKKGIYIISILIFCLLIQSEKINALNISPSIFSLHTDTVINLITKDTVFEESYPKDSIIKNLPIGRLAKTNEIAVFVLFLVSELNSYMTGQTVVVDGGYTIQ